MNDACFAGFNAAIAFISCSLKKTQLALQRFVAAEDVCVKLPVAAVFQNRLFTAFVLIMILKGHIAH